MSNELTARPGKVIKSGPAPWSQPFPMEPPFPKVMVNRWKLPAPIRPEDARAALHALVARHEGLRTTFGTDTEGQIIANVHETSPPAIVEMSLGDLSDPSQEDDRIFQLMDLLRSKRIDPRCQLPVRFAIVTDGLMTNSVIIAVSHAVSDMWANRILRQDFETMIQGSGPPPNPPPGDVEWTPLKLGAFERSADFSVSRHRSLEYWHSTLDRIPTHVFPSCSTGHGFREFALRSAVLTRAATWIAYRCATTSSSVLLAAYVLAVAKQSGLGECPVQLISSNRFNTRMRHVVASVAQPILITVETGDAPPFHELVKRCLARMAEGVRHSRYDPIEIRRIKDHASRARGTQISLRNFNFRAHAMDAMRAPWASGPPDVSELRVDDAIVVAEKPDLSDNPPGPTLEHVVVVDLHRDITRLSVVINTAYVDPSRAAELLHDMEAITARAARDYVEID